VGSGRVEKLYDTHIACLRLVDEGLSSKEIALKLNLSPATVDSYMRDAIRYFEVTNRRQAANKIREIGDLPDPSRLRRQPVPVAPPADAGKLDLSYAPPAARSGRWTLREMPVQYRAESAAAAPPMPAAIESERHVRSRFSILLQIAALTAALVIVLSAAEPIGRGFDRLAHLILQLRNE